MDILWQIDCMDLVQFNDIVPRRSSVDKVGSAFDLMLILREY
jgi:hypothetical protein